ncbi:MAG: LysR family transcriptional regulator [Clostridia bacterium]|nr:LysR family transcriptional regulator [Clostridia bacterium]
MEILQLMYFCAAAETENFAEAGKRQGVPAASVSQSVRRLEKELGVTLFNRQANSVELNERGRAFYIKAKSGLDILADAKNKVCDDIVEGAIKLLVITNTEAVNRAVAEFCTKYKNVTFKIDHEKKDHYDKYDLIITDNFPFNEAYSRNRGFEDEIVLAVNKEHPLALEKNIKPLDLQNEKFILFNEGSGMLTLAKRICAYAGFSPKICVQCDDEYSVARCVEMNVGVAFVPKKAFENLLSDKVILKKVDDVTRATVICYNKYKYMTKAVRLFLDTFLEIANGK